MVNSLVLLLAFEWPTLMSVLPNHCILLGRVIVGFSSHSLFCKMQVGSHKWAKFKAGHTLFYGHAVEFLNGQFQEAYAQRH